MMELYIFDRDLNFQGILESFFSLIWTRRYSKCGEFELHCNLTPETIELLKRENIIWKKGDLEAGYIEYRNLSQDSNGQETLVVKGKFLTGYIGRRIIWGTENLNTTAELGIRELINNHAINTTNTDRKIDLFALGDLKNYTQTLKKQASYKNLLETIEEIANTNELGIRTFIDIQNKQMIFDIYECTNRTGQSVNAPAIFSKEFENILEQEYTDSLNNYRNVVLVAGEGEGTERELVIVGESTGLDRFEMFVDARDLQSTKKVDDEEAPIPIEDYREMLESRGLSKLSEHKEVRTFDSKINLNSNLTYKEDFDLGDVVTRDSKVGNNNI